MSTDESGLVPASLDVIAPKRPCDRGNPVRVSFVPFGRTDVGDPDPAADGYRIIDAYAYMATPAVVRDTPSRVNLRGIDGTEYVVADGDEFRPDTDLPEWAKDDLDLSEYGRVLGYDDGRGGYRAVGLNPVFMTEEGP